MRVTRGSGFQRLSRSVFLAVGLLVSLPTGTVAESRTGLSMYVDRHMQAAWPWQAGRSGEAFSVVSDLVQKLQHTRSYGAEIASLTTETFKGYPLLVLTDQDGDAEADFFAYHAAAGGGDTLEFGAFFTEPGADTPYWLVFNSGMGLEMSADGTPGVYWINYQFVDRNRDGRIDAYGVNDLDAAGKGYGSPTDVLWLYDSDFDGLFDRGEEIVGGEARAVPVVDGAFVTRRLGEDGPESRMPAAAALGGFGDAIAADIRRALAAGDRPDPPEAVPYLADHAFPDPVSARPEWREYRLGDLNIRLPGGIGWQQERTHDTMQIIGGLRFDTGGALVTADAIIVAQGVLTAPIFDEWVPAELATRERELEIWNMRQQGAYALEGVQMGDTTIDGRTFHFLRHLQVFDDEVQQDGARRMRQELHILFPPDFAESHAIYKIFLMRLCRHAACDTDMLDVTDLRWVLSEVSFEATDP